MVNKSKINVKPRRLERIRREIDFMANINHPHIVKILEGNTLSNAIQLISSKACYLWLNYLNQEDKRFQRLDLKFPFLFHFSVREFRENNISHGVR